MAGALMDPFIGAWITYCCEEDLRQIDSAEALVIEQIAEGVCAPLGIWPTREAALKWLANDSFGSGFRHECT